MFRKILPLLLTALMLFSLLPAVAEEVPGLETDVAEIQKYGNLVLDIKGSTLLEQGYEYGDMASIEILGESYAVPVGSNYSDVDTGSMILRVVDNAEGDAVIWAINMGDLATTLGLASKETIEEDPGFKWTYAEGLEQPVAVTIQLLEKGGYADEYMIHQLTRSIERADYPDLTDEQYANFRNIATTGMGAGALYRSSSPVNPELNRNKEADEALNNAGVATIMNLADSLETMEAYEDYPYTHYSTRAVIALNLGVDFAADDFRTGLAEGLRFFAENEGPYLVHCTEGKDRAGFVSALLECLMGASCDEVIGDYMITYYNYYGVEEGTEQYEAIVRSNIKKSLGAAFQVEDIAEADLAACAERYLLDCGLGKDELNALKENLAKDYTK